MAKDEVVILLHGLGRYATSMWPLKQALKNDYEVINKGYPSRKSSIRDLTEEHILPLVQEHQNAKKIHFVCHSLGGILVRQLVHIHRPKNLGRTVMLGPPNRGSELADTFSKLALYRAINGPAGIELGTDTESVPNQLGKVDFEVGVIAGNRSPNPLFSKLIEGKDDGKVSVERSKVTGMKDHIVLPVTHTFMMRDKVVIRQVQHFLENGKFMR